MRVLFYIAFFILLASCDSGKKGDCFKKAGDMNTAERFLDSFSSVKTSDRLIVKLVQDSSQAGKIELSGPENLLDQILTYVENEELKLENNNTCNFVRSFDHEIVLTVYIHSIHKITINGSSVVESSDTLHLQNLALFHNALSDIDLLLNCKGEVYINSFNSAKTILSGKAKVLKGSIEEISSVDARNLQCQEVLLDQHSPVDCYIDAEKIIFVKLYNTGNIYYISEPSEYKEVNYRRSTGDLILLQ